jgi:hypothetical protein
VNDGVQLLYAAFREGDARKGTAVELPVGQQNTGTEMFDDSDVDGVARLHHLAADGVRLENMSSMLREEIRSSGLSATQSSGKANA